MTSLEGEVSQLFRISPWHSHTQQDDALLCLLAFERKMRERREVNMKEERG